MDELDRILIVETDVYLLKSKLFFRVKIKIIKGYWLKTGMNSIIKLSRDKNVD
jgi:hypothetical protein